MKRIRISRSSWWTTRITGWGTGRGIPGFCGPQQYIILEYLLLRTGSCSGLVKRLAGVREYLYSVHVCLRLAASYKYNSRASGSCVSVRGASAGTVASSSAACSFIVEPTGIHPYHVCRPRTPSHNGRAFSAASPRCERPFGPGTYTTNNPRIAPDHSALMTSSSAGSGTGGCPFAAFSH